MQLGMIGLARMGANMVRRPGRAGHECVVYDISGMPVQALAREGAQVPHRTFEGNRPTNTIVADALTPGPRSGPTAPPTR